MVPQAESRVSNEIATASRKNMVSPSCLFDDMMLLADLRVVNIHGLGFEPTDSPLDVPHFCGCGVFEFLMFCAGKRFPKNAISQTDAGYRQRADR
jgi:hypothetical protein